MQLNNSLSKIKRSLTQKEKDYQKYLRSKKWRDFRTKLLKKRGKHCTACNIYKKRLEFHHITYERFGNELESDVVILCHSCHKLVTRMYLRNKRQNLPLVTQRVIQYMQKLVLLEALDN
jgi:5-methylcytosine-specific restriction endonuclease McrA